MDLVIKQAVSYLRVSDPKQVENFSLENQEDLILKKAVAEGYQIVRTFREEGESAKSLNRTELKKLIKFCTVKENKITAVFIYKYDRLNRNSLEFMILRQMFAKLGISLISATEVSGSTPEVMFVQNLLSAFSEFENTVKSQRVQQGMQRRFQAGYTSRESHFGYKRELVDGKTLEVPDGDRFTMLQSMWRKIAYEQWSLSMVRKHLDDSGLFKKFSKQTISKIFSETFYFGQLESKKYGVAKGLHQPMIDEETFYQARAIVTGRILTRTPKNTKLREELPLRGILLCPQCKAILTGAPSTSRNGSRIFYYSCNDRKHKFFGLNADKTNDAFLEFLKKVKAKPKAIQFFEELMTEQYESEFKDLQSSSKQVRKDVEIVEATLTRLKRKHLQGLYDDQEFAEMKEELKIELIEKKQLLGEKEFDKAGIQEVLTWMRIT